MSAVAHESDCCGFADARADAEGVCANWCWTCCRCEPSRDGDYRVCSECFHVFRSATDLLNAHNVVMAKVGCNCPSETDPDKVFSCPACAHDF